jgi:carbamate kinase
MENLESAGKAGVAVLAIGGNSLIRDKQHQRVSDQFQVTRETCQHIASMVEGGWRVVVTHGNGPQVGFVLRRSELSISELHPVPMDSAGADTQGSIGYMIQQSLDNEFRKRGLGQHALTVVTQVLVDPLDPAFEKPSKPIGSFMEEKEAMERKNKEGWVVQEDSGRGWRRVVPSPRPVEIIERSAIRRLLSGNYIVVAVGGGGIPVVRDEDGLLSGREAVIDKDMASALLARRIHADMLMISTAVEKVCLNFGKPDEKQLDKMTLTEAKKYLAEGHFAPGSMSPKIQAIIEFLEGGGKQAMVTTPEKIEATLAGQAGTRVVRD